MKLNTLVLKGFNINKNMQVYTNIQSLNQEMYYLRVKSNSSNCWLEKWAVTAVYLCRVLLFLALWWGLLTQCLYTVPPSDYLITNMTYIHMVSRDWTTEICYFLINWLKFHPAVPLSLENMSNGINLKHFLSNSQLITLLCQTVEKLPDSDAFFV